MSSDMYWDNLDGAKKSRRLIYLVVSTIVVAITWSAIASLDEVVVGTGTVVPSQSVHKVQSLEGGILREILVSPGERVKKGQSLAVLDDTRSRAAYQESDQLRSSLLAKRSRILAELDSVTVSDDERWQHAIKVEIQPLPDTGASPASMVNALANYQERLQQQRTMLDTSRENVLQQIQSLSEVESQSRTASLGLALIERELKLVEEMVKAGSVAEVELLEYRREQIKFSGELEASQLTEKKIAAARDQVISEQRSIALEYRTRAQNELNETDASLAQLHESLSALADQLARTKIESPVAGIVKDIAVRSVGGVVKPGEDILQVVPIDDKLIVETRISPKDIAFLHKGMASVVKFTAYDFVVYGGLDGTVEYVSADTLKDEEGNNYYRVHVMTDTNHFREWPIIPGMQATVDIVTGKKTVLNYWLKPVLRARANAMREP